MDNQPRVEQKNTFSLKIFNKTIIGMRKQNMVDKKTNKVAREEAKKLRKAYRVTSHNYKTTTAKRILNKTKLLH